MINQILMWPFIHEQTFWGLILAFGIGMALGRGSFGRWRNWFE